MRILNLSEKMTQHHIKNVDLVKATQQAPKTVSAWKCGKAYPKEQSLIYLLSIFKNLEVETDDGQVVILQLEDQTQKTTKEA